MAIDITGTVNNTINANGTLRIGHVGGNGATVGLGAFTVDDGSVLVLEDPGPEIYNDPSTPDNPLDPALSIGRYSGSVGYGLITGAGSTVSLQIDPGTTDPQNTGAGVSIGRDGGQGSLFIEDGGRLELIASDLLSFNAINVGRGTDPLGYGKTGQGFLQVTNGTVAVEGGLSATLRVGRDGGDGFALIEEGSQIDLIATTNNGNARLQVAQQSTATTGQTNGTMIVSNSTINIESTGNGGGAGVSVASDVNGNLASKLVGRLVLTDNAIINVTGERAAAVLGNVANASAQVTIDSGSKLIVTDTDVLDQGGAFIGIGTAVGVLQSTVTVTGMGSRLEAVSGTILVGRNASAGGTGNGLLTLTDEGTLAANNVSVERGGTLVASDASIDGQLGLNAGTLRLTTGGALTLTKGLFASGGATLHFDVADDGSGGLINGSLALTGVGNTDGAAFADTKMVIDALGGTKFSNGDILTLGTSNTGFFFLNQMKPADVSVTGQGAGFGFLLSTAGSSLTFQALNNGAAPALAVLDFGSTSLSGATFTYDTGARAGRGNGGVLGDLIAREVDDIRGTAAADVFTLIGSGGLVLRGFDGNDTLLGALGADTLDGGTGADKLIGKRGLDMLTGGANNDTFIYTTITDSAPGTSADRILDFDDLGDDKIDLAAVYGPTLSYIGTAAFTKIGQVRINDITGADLLVEVNLDADKAAEMQIRLVNTTLASMSKGDFLL